MLKRYCIFVFINMFIILNPAIAEEIKAKIKSVCLTGLFENSSGDPYFKTDYLLPVDRRIHKVEFSCGTATCSIRFIATDVKTTLDKDGKYYSDEVKIEYYSLANSVFYQNDAILKFKGYDENGIILPISKVIDYRKADFVSSGWILKTDTFPESEVKFISKDSGTDKGATDRAWFILKYSYPATEK